MIIFRQTALFSNQNLSNWHHRDYKTIYEFWKRRLWNKMNKIVTQSLQQQLDLEPINKSLKNKHRTILEMERNMQGLQRSHIKIWCWTYEFWKHRKDLQGIGHFYHKRWYDVKYGLGVFRKCIVTNDDLHGGRCDWLFIQMRGCCILLNHNMWFWVVEIKTKHGLL